jgi:hypothetical protein
MRLPFLFRGIFGSQAGLPHGLPWSKPNFFHERRIRLGDELALHRLGGLIPTELAADSFKSRAYSHAQIFYVGVIQRRDFRD